MNNHSFVASGLCRGLACLALGGFAASSALRHSCIPSGTSAEGTSIKARVVMQTEGAVTRFLVENRELCEVTVTFNVALHNLDASVTFPHTATFAPGTTNPAFSLKPIRAGATSYSFTNDYKLGSNLARHNDDHVYQLPFAAEKRFKVTQGYGGKFSHHGPNHYSIDWRMPVGTPVQAARGGRVVKVRDDSGRGGARKQFAPLSNYVIIRHDDGTLGQYCHLQQAGARVREGETVKAGDVLALSGNTGFSSGPHLHFAVFKARNGQERETIPVQFQSRPRQGWGWGG